MSELFATKIAEMTSQNNHITWLLIATLTLFLILFRNFLTKVSQEYQPSEPNPAISWMKLETKNTTEFTRDFEVFKRNTS